jgi:hypothetical protein
MTSKQLQPTDLELHAPLLPVNAAQASPAWVWLYVFEAAQS